MANAKDNRFKKSLENLDAKNKDISGKIDNIDSDMQDNILNNIDSNTQDNILNNTFNNVKADILSNILETIVVKEPQGKSVALYLSNEVDELVTKLAKQKGVSKSKLVDNILRQILLTK